VKLDFGATLCAFALASCIGAEDADQPTVRMVTELALPPACARAEDLDIAVSSNIGFAGSLSDVERALLKRRVEERLRPAILPDAVPRCSGQSVLGKDEALRIDVSFSAQNQLLDMGRELQDTNFGTVVGDCARGYDWTTMMDVGGRLAASMDTAWGRCDQKVVEIRIDFDATWLRDRRDDALAAAATLIAFGIQGVGSDLKLAPRRQSSPRPLDDVYREHPSGIIARSVGIVFK
jgi:hypothetical protein